MQQMSIFDYSVESQPENKLPPRELERIHPRMVSLFSGCGGLDLGFDNAGFHTIWANDFDVDACKTHQNWSDAEVICGDISKVDIAKIPNSDIILGGFPVRVLV